MGLGGDLTTPRPTYAFGADGHVWSTKCATSPYLRAHATLTLVANTDVS